MKKISLLLAFSFLFFGCSAPEEEEVTKETGKPVPTQIVQRGNFTPVLEFSGTLLPKNEATISAEASGTVYSVWAEEGAEVFAGQTLLSFSAGNNLAQVDLQNAQTAFNDAKKALSLTQQQVGKSLETSELAVEQAQSNLDSAKRTNYSTGTSVSAQKESAESSITLAELSVENTQQSYEELLKTLETNENNLKETKKNSVSSSLAVFRKVLSDADGILGVNEETRKGNDSFEVFLGFREPQTKIDSVNLFRGAWTLLVGIESRHAVNPEEITIDEMEIVANGIRNLLQELDIMLKQSVSGAGFTEATLTGFQTQTSANRSSLEASIASLSAAFQQMDSFTTSRPQQIRAAELAIEQAEKQLSQSQSSLAQIESGGEVSVVGTENQVENAKNALLSAKSHLEFAEKQNDLSVQQALTAKNNALSSLRRAQIQAGKLAVTSPISGIITKKNINTGDTVNTGSSLFSVAHVNTLVLSGEIEPNMLASVKVGSTADIEIDGFSVQKGFVSKVHLVASEITRRIPLEISLNNSAREVPANIFAKASLHLPTEEEVILIPQNALISQNPAAVYILAESETEGKTVLTVKKQEIKTGRTQKDNIEVLEGLFAGERIIPQPIAGLKEGDEVEINKE